MSHDSDGEYDPEQMLKKSLMASTVKIPDRPSKRSSNEANKKLVLKAVEDADKSIKRRKTEDKNSG